MHMPKRAAIAIAAAAAIAIGLLGTLPAAAAENQAAPTASSAAPLAPNSMRPNYSGHDSSDVTGSTGRCYSALCLYYNSGEAGAMFNTDENISNLLYYTFPDNGNGFGDPVKNDAASAENQGPDVDIIYYNSNFIGNFDYLYPNSFGQLVNTYNNDASVAI